MYSRALDNDCAQNNDPKVLEEHFKVLKETLFKYNIKPHNIYSMDEKGFLIGLIQLSRRVIVPASEKTAFI